MSGIVTILSSEGRPLRDALRRGTAALAHRGPAGEGLWLDPGGAVGLGHRRLGAGEAPQPVASEDGRLHVALSGQIVGVSDCDRRLLEERGHALCTGSDAEVVLGLYRELGTACLERLRGEFAFVLWDASNGVLFAARDRFGARPLFYAQVDGDLFLASEAKALFAAGVPAAWDEEAVYQQLFCCLEEDRSLFAGVRAVPPGGFLLASRHHVQVRRYWDLDYPLADRPPACSDEEFVERLRSRLDEAVRLRMEGDGPVGFFVSGGLDSSTVLSLGAAHSPQPVTAFTVTFGEEGYDEEEAARTAVERAGARFHPIPVTDRDLADHLADAIWQGEMLGLNVHGVARYVQSRVVRDAGYRVALSGEGSDDVLGGYPSAKEDMLRQAAPPAPEQGTAGSGVAQALDGVRRRLGFVPAWMRKVAITRSVFHALLAPGFSDSFAGRDPYRLFIDRCDADGQLHGREPVIQALYLWSKAFLAGYALCAERLAMGYSVEERVPFMDHHLFALIRQMPASLLIRDGREKWVLREAARPLLAASTCRRPKHSFAAPPGLVTPGTPLYERMQDALRSSALATVPFFDTQAVAALLDQLPELPQGTRVGLEPVLLMIVCTCILQERYRL